MLYQTRDEYYKNPKYCFCGNIISYDKRLVNKYCSFKCSGAAQSNKRTERLLSGLLNDNAARNAFRKIAEKKCSICKLSEWMGKEIPLVVDHIDGNHNNNITDNLRMICCNCDAQLPTYKAKNKGNGRIKRRA